MSVSFYPRTEGQLGLGGALSDKDDEYMEIMHLQWKLEEAKKREEEVEKDLEGLWVFISKLKYKSDTKRMEYDHVECQKKLVEGDKKQVLLKNHVKIQVINENDWVVDGLKACLEMEHRRNKELNFSERMVCS